jgi:arylsulfatase A-like enzyme
MKMNTFSPVFLGLVSLFACQEKSVHVENRPDIIFIMTDDHAFQAISAYGGRLAELAPTPNIDRLAESGMIFNRCLVTNSICGPSRATILTGKYGHINGFHSNEMTDFDASQQTFPKLFQSEGYQTAVIGKWHLGSTPTGFDHYDILPGQGHYYNPDFINGEGTYRLDGYVTDIITDKSLEWLSKATESDKPYMLMMHHKAPHREWEPALEYLDAFDDVFFPVPPTLFDNWQGRGKAAKEQDMTISETLRIDADLKMWGEDTEHIHALKNTYERLNTEQRHRWDAYYDSVKAYFDIANPEGADLILWKYQRYLSDYLATIISVDKSVGKVLDFLEENGRLENTIVVYTSDQGFYLGEHGWFDKRFMYEESYRTPLLISWPEVIKPCTESNLIVSNLDFAPTFLDAIGAEIPEDMQGESLLPILNDEKPAEWRTEHYYHYYAYPDYHSVKRHYGISTERYKLMHFYYDIDEWELYDLKKDPYEMVNLYNHPLYCEIKQELHARLKELRIKYRDSDELTKSFLP